MSRWTLIYDKYEPGKRMLHEALTTLGNGYFATRGAFEECRFDPDNVAESLHYPGTYLAGGYNRATTEVAGRDVVNEDLVNFPNWLPLTFRIDGGQWFTIDKVEVLDYRLELQIEKGVLFRKLRFQDDAGRITQLECRRIVSLCDMHYAGIEWNLTPENWGGQVEVKSGLDGTVINHGVKRYRDLESQHLEPVATDTVGDDAIYLHVQTTQSRLEMAQAARTRVFVEQDPVAVTRQTHQEPGYIDQTLGFAVEQGKRVRIEKLVAIYTSRDHGISEAGAEAREAVHHLPDFARLAEDQERTWRHAWQRCDIDLDNGPRAQLILRTHIFHLLQTCSPNNTVDLDVGMPARGLHGEAYRGHIFWDEVFIFPYLLLRLPELIRSLLMYRYRRLPAARQLAKAEGFRGAMFPWQSGSNGQEETQVLHLNPKSGRWLPDNTHRQRHMNASLIYNVWMYYQATGDLDWMTSFGARMFLEVTQFWSSICEFNPERGRYEIRGVVGPDEFHTRYPDTEEVGLNNNAYTNVMVAWIMDVALRLLNDVIDTETRAELLEDLAIGDAELERWRDISTRMFVPMLNDEIILQFEGYEKLQEMDWDGLRKRHGNIQRLDRILEAEGDDINRYQAGKQADVLMLFYLFSLDELKRVFNRLGYPMNVELVRKNVQYHLARTSHGSTLSRVVAAWVLARSDRGQAWALFQDALESDISDIQGGTTAEGVHLGAMSGTVDVVQRCYPGLEFRDDALFFSPRLPDAINEIGFRCRYRGNSIRVNVTHKHLTITVERSGAGPARIGVYGEVFQLEQGEIREFPIKR
jgi:trehalose/maltose hydrolase-like predicted phosphorylase